MAIRAPSTSAAALLVPTFPSPAAPPIGMAVVRADQPAPPPSLANGPFRTPGTAFREIRSATTLTIRFPHRRHARSFSAAAVAWLAVVAGLGCAGAIAAVWSCGLAVPPLLVSLGLRRFWRTRIDITPTRIKASGGTGLRRDDVTHIFCVGVFEGAAAEPLWHVRVRVGAVDHVLVITNSIDDANAAAALLARELRLPTWVPTERQR